MAHRFVAASLADAPCARTPQNNRADFLDRRGASIEMTTVAAAISGASNGAAG